MATRIERISNYIILTDTVSGITIAELPTGLLSYTDTESKLFLWSDNKGRRIAIGNTSGYVYTDFVQSGDEPFIDRDALLTFLRASSGITASRVDVVIQDSTSPIMIVKASKLVTETSLTAQPSIGDYTIDIASAASFAIGQYLTVYNEIEDRVFFANVLSINVLEITLDTPLDFAFPISSFVSVGDVNLAVDGSITPQVFGIRNPTGVDIPLKFDIVRVIFSCLANSSIDLSKFGDIAGGIARGIVVRRVDGYYQNIFNAKTNAELKNIMYDFDIETAQGSQQDGFTTRITFGGQNKMGAVVRIGADEDMQIIVQDDLTSLVSFILIAEGSQVVD